MHWLTHVQFIIEGLLSVFAAFAAYFMIPNSVATASFLNEEERAYGTQRLAGAGHAEFSWSEVKRGVLSIQLWLTATAYFCILSCVQSFALFLPTVFAFHPCVISC